MKTTNRGWRGKRRGAGDGSRLIVGAALLPILLFSASVALGQAYGVRRTTVVRGPNRTVVHSRTTVAARGPALPRGYIAALPGGYRAVVVSGARYYTVRGVYYRPRIYGGRTVYVVVHL